MSSKEKVSIAEIPQITDIDIRGRSLRLVGVEYGINNTSVVLRELISNSNSVIVEYFPPELETTTFRVPFVGDFAANFSVRSNVGSFYNDITLIAAEMKKDIVVMDPANNIEFGALDLGLSPALESAEVGTLGFSLMLARTKRRTALAIGLTSLLAVTSGYGIAHNNQINPDDLRRVVVSQGLAQDANDKAVLFYSPQHINDGLIPYLNNSDYRNWKYSIYSKIPGITRSIRRYSARPDNQWDLVSSTPIL